MKSELLDDVSVFETLFAAFNAEIKNKVFLADKEIVVLFKNGNVARIKTKYVA